AGHRDLPPFPTRRSSDLSDWSGFLQAYIQTVVGGIAKTKCGCRILKNWKARQIRATNTILSDAEQKSPIWHRAVFFGLVLFCLRSEEHTSELQSRETLVC